MGHTSVRALQWYDVSIFRNTDIKGSVLVCVCGWWIRLWSPGAMGHNPAKRAQTHLTQTRHFRVSHSQVSEEMFFFFNTVSSTSKFCIYDSPFYLVMYATAEGHFQQCLACQCQCQGFHLWKLMLFFTFVNAFCETHPRAPWSGLGFCLCTERNFL